MAHRLDPSLEIQKSLVEMLIDINDYGLENLPRNELGVVDIDNRHCYPGIDQIIPNLYYDYLRKSGAHLFVLGTQVDKKIFDLVSKLIKVWDVNEIPIEMAKSFEFIPPGSDGIEFIGDFDGENYSLLKIKIKENLN
jgi:hypothetical protein